MNIRKVFFYPWLLRVRVRLLSDSRLIDKLTKRAHILDKANLDNQRSRIKRNEVKIHLEEVFRRDIEPNNNIKWAWKVLGEYYLKNSEQKDKVGSPKKPKDIQAKNSELKKAIEGRRSVRFWQDKPVKLELIKEIIDIAKWAPSSCNRQPWKFLILTKKSDIEFAKKITNQDFFTNSSLLIIPLIDKEKYANKDHSYAFIDVGIVIQNILLLLHQQGLGGCCMGIQLDKSNRKNIEEFQQRFNIDNKYQLSVFIPVGWPKKDVPKPARMETEKLIEVRK
jgi:nitroreductase